MMYGRGVYMSEFPGMSLNYGNGLLLCMVVLGSIETISMDDVPKLRLSISSLKVERLSRMVWRSCMSSRTVNRFSLIVSSTYSTTTVLSLHRTTCHLQRTISLLHKTVMCLLAVLPLHQEICLQMFCIFLQLIRPTRVIILKTTKRKSKSWKSV